LDAIDLIFDLTNPYARLYNSCVTGLGWDVCAVRAAHINQWTLDVR
jgi:hypothetical protein